MKDNVVKYIFLKKHNTKKGEFYVQRIPKVST